MGHLGTTPGKNAGGRQPPEGAPRGSGQEPGTPAECRRHPEPIQSSALVPEGLPPGWPQMAQCGGAQAGAVGAGGAFSLGLGFSSQ